MVYQDNYQDFAEPSEIGEPPQRDAPWHDEDESSIDMPNRTAVRTAPQRSNSLEVAQRHSDRSNLQPAASQLEQTRPLRQRSPAPPAAAINPTHPAAPVNSPYQYEASSLYEPTEAQEYLAPPTIDRRVKPSVAAPSTVSMYSQDVV